MKLKSMMKYFDNDEITVRVLGRYSTEDYVGRARSVPYGMTELEVSRILAYSPGRGKSRKPMILIHVNDDWEYDDWEYEDCENNEAEE